MITYKEFEKQVNALGYTVLLDGRWLRVIKEYESTNMPTAYYVNISTKFMNSMDSVNGNIMYDDLFQLCVKLASTPIKDREEVQLYTLELCVEEEYSITDNGLGIYSISLERCGRNEFTLEEIEEMDMKGFKKVKLE